MAAHRRLFIFCVLSIFTAFGVGCGSGSSNQTAGTPQGSFSASNLNGTYAFTTSGTNSNGSNNYFFSVAGSMQADGNGTITGGTVDINSPVTSNLLTNSPITGTYTVGADGRGAATINTSIGAFHLDFVLISNSHGLVTRFDTTATASGSLDLQTASDFSLSSLAGSFAFGLSGVDGGGNSEVNGGVVTIDSSGDITSGIEDVNDSGAVSSSVVINATPGAASSPNATSGRGQIAVTSTLGTFTFAYYVIDNTHLDLVEIDLCCSSDVLAGVAYNQTSATIPAGSYVFTDGGSTASGPFAAAGILNVDGAGNIQSSSEEDINSAGSLSSAVALAGTYSATLTNGRGTATINGGLGTANFAIYPSSGGIFLVETDATAVTSGIAIPQTGSGFTTASISGIYALGLSGENTNGEIDLTSQFTANGTGGLTGALDLNNVGTLTNNLALSGTYSITGSNGRGTAVLQTSAGTIDVVFYAVSSSKAICVELDNGEVALGSFQLQQ